MLIEFNVSNFLSIREKQSLNMTAAYSSDDLSENLIDSELPGMSGIRFIKSAAVYGANASGKTNLLAAVNFMRHFVVDSAVSLKPGQETGVVPFRLDKKKSAQPSEFEVIFSHEGVRYQYGFALDKKKVLSEWLHSFPEGKPRKLFARQFDPDTQTYSYKSGIHFEVDRSLEAKTRPNALFLSVGVQFNQRQMMKPYEWFHDYLRVLNLEASLGLSPEYTARRILKDPQLEAAYSGLLRQADLGVDGIQVKLLKAKEAKIQFPEDMPEEIRRGILSELTKKDFLNIELVHKSSDGSERVNFNLEVESAGTQRLFALIGPWREALENGYCLFVDEIDASMHPLLTKMLIRMIHNSELNKNGAQLVFTTHDTALLDSELLRRDQIWFTEKDQGGGTQLYPLTDYKPRKDESPQKGYLAGRYGAIPFLSGEFTF